jgi:hypothetical protein
MQKEIAMRTHTQLQIFFAVVLIALAMLAIVTAPPQELGAETPKGHAVVALPQDGREPGLAVHPARLGLGTADGRVESRFQVNRQAAPASQPRAISFLPVVTYLSGGLAPASVAIADVNGDGKLDVVVANANSDTLAVLLGDGGGTFQTAVTYGSGGRAPLSVVVADVNGDGKPDLVVANSCASTCATGLIAVLFGNGDGTFQAAVTYDSGGVSAQSVAVADVNRDGKLDVVVANQTSNTVGVLLGNGDGTFQPAVAYGSGSNSFTWSVVVADVNADGNPDLVVADECDNYPTCTHGTVGVLLGNGNGTFQAAVVYFSGGSEANSVAVSDVNGDGRLDLIVGNNCFSCGDSTVSVQLGNGDGTFQSPVTNILTLSRVFAVAVADVNGDGKADLLVAGDIGNGGRVASLLGNGDGSFQAAVLYNTNGVAGPVAVADVNGDGKLDVVLTNEGNYVGTSTVGVLISNTVFTPTTTKLGSSPNPSLVGQAVTFTATVSSAAGTPPDGETVTFTNGSVVLGIGSLSGGSASLTTSSLPVGPSTITSSYPGDSTFGASTSAPLKQVVNPTGKYTTSTAIGSNLNPSTYGQKITWTATVTTTGSVAPTGKVQFTWSGHTIGSATLNSSAVATLSKSNLNANTYPLTAVYLGDAADLGSTSAVLNQVVLEATSAATLTSSPNPSTQGQAVTFTATITSPTVKPKGPVTFTAGKTVLGTGQLSGGKATLTISSLAVGSTTVTATYNGDSNIAKSSASVTQTVH